MSEIIEKTYKLLDTLDNSELIKKAYECANSNHKEQNRVSGEKYINHPLNVAYILAEMNADYETICAGLLHDTLEDTEITKEEISELINPTVAELVDGVTKLCQVTVKDSSAK